MLEESKRYSGNTAGEFGFATPPQQVHDPRNPTFAELPLLEDAEIMRNILYSGIWLRFENATERRKAKKEQ